MYAYAKYRWARETQLSLALLKVPTPGRRALALEATVRAERWIEEMHTMEEYIIS